MCLDIVSESNPAKDTNCCGGGCKTKIHDVPAGLSQEKKQGEAFLICRGGYGSASVLDREVVFAEAKDAAEKFAAEKYPETQWGWHRVETIPFTVFLGGRCPFCSSGGFPFDLSEPIGP